MLTGNVIGSCHGQHRHEEFLRFLATIDRQVPKPLAVHPILDNYATHKHAAVRDWLTKPPPPLHAALHPDLIVLAEPGRTLVSRTHRQSELAAEVRAIVALIPPGAVTTYGKIARARCHAAAGRSGDVDAG